MNSEEPLHDISRSKTQNKGTVLKAVREGMPTQSTIRNITTSDL